MHEAVKITQNAATDVFLELDVNESNATTVTLRASGLINEDVNLNSLIKTIVKTGARRLTIDYSKVTQINSCGVRELLIMMRDLYKKIPIVVESASEAIIELVINVPALLGSDGAYLISFAAPYYCEACDIRHVPMLDRADYPHPIKSFKAPAYACKECGGETSFDAMEEDYLTFLSYTRPIA